MRTTIQHIYKQLHECDGLLYAWFAAMHTRVDIMLCGSKSESEGVRVVELIGDELQRLEAIGNFYDPESELSKVNRTAFLHPVALSGSLYEMADMCLKYHEKTLGCFDIAIRSQPYSAEAIRSVCLLPREQSVVYRCQGVTLDFSGFLKGYALESIRKILGGHGIANALINMGNSSVLALGDHPFGEGWKIDFNLCGDVCANTCPTVLLRNECLTTSGNDSEGRKHIRSPQTGEWVEGVRRLAVVTDNGAIGEILSTALFAATPGQRPEILKNIPVKRMIEI